MNLQHKRRPLHVGLCVMAAMCFLGISTIALAASEDGWLQRPMQEQWDDSVSSSHVFDPMGDVDADWWRSFNDPVLSDLINKGIEANYDVLTAARRINVARYQLDAARGGYLPTIDLSAGWSKEQSSGLTAGSTGRAMRGSTWAGTLTMNWEIDVFGRVAAASKAKKASWRASRADYGATMLSLEAEIASTYVGLRQYQTQLQVANTHAANQAQVVKITEARFNAALASKLDVAQARRTYYSTLATIPAIESGIQTSLNALSVLVGQFPEALTEQLSPFSPIPEYHHIVTVGLPMDLLTRRPDVVAARLQIDAQAAALGMAKKDYLPSLAFTGSLGTEAHDAGDLFTRQSFTWSVAPTLSWTVFDGLQRRYAVAEAREQMRIAVDSYNQTVMTAVQEADNAMSSYMASTRQLEFLKQLVLQSQEALRLSLELYKTGLSSFTNVVDAEMAYLEAENSLVSAQAGVATSLVTLYKALGGGYQQQ